jgi:hypothetical protein
MVLAPGHDINTKWAIEAVSGQVLYQFHLHETLAGNVDNIFTPACTPAQEKRYAAPLYFKNIKLCYLLLNYVIYS